MELGHVVEKWLLLSRRKNYQYLISKKKKKNQLKTK